MTPQLIHQEHVIIRTSHEKSLLIEIAFPQEPGVCKTDIYFEIEEILFNPSSECITPRETGEVKKGFRKAYRIDISQQQGHYLVGICMQLNSQITMDY